MKNIGQIFFLFFGIVIGTTFFSSNTIIQEANASSEGDRGKQIFFYENTVTFPNGSPGWIEGSVDKNNQLTFQYIHISGDGRQSRNINQGSTVQVYHMPYKMSWHQNHPSGPWIITLIPPGKILETNFTMR